jgi:N6-L-threonylcarbamoyladenine synthase
LINIKKGAFGSNMLILGIDTSCDDTSAAIVKNGTKIKSSIVSSQNEIHEKFGGIVPELASRRHIEMVWPVIHEAFQKAGAGPDDISAIAVCHGPGLIGSLLVGVCFAKSLAYVYKKPLIAINHLEGHIFSSFLEKPVPHFPFIALVVSGGHTSIYKVEGINKYTELGRTIDDAAGEAFDKTAKLLGLGYPGGPFIDQLSEKGDPEAISFPRPFMKKGLDFSFSGLKTAVMTYLKKDKQANIEDISASFQAAVIEVLVTKTIDAAITTGVERIVLTGGVSANRDLRKVMKEKANEKGLEVYLLPASLCTDNAAMIASAGHYHFLEGDFANFDLNPKAYMTLS